MALWINRPEALITVPAGPCARNHSEIRNKVFVTWPAMSGTGWKTTGTTATTVHRPTALHGWTSREVLSGSCEAALSAAAMRRLCARRIAITTKQPRGTQQLGFVAQDDKADNRPGLVGNALIQWTNRRFPWTEPRCMMPRQKSSTSPNDRHRKDSQSAFYWRTFSNVMVLGLVV